MRFLAPVFANLFLLLSAFGWGALLRPLLPSGFSKLDRLAIFPLAGLGIQGLLLFLLGLIWFTPVSTLLILVPGAILGIRTLRHELADTLPSFAHHKIPAIPLAVIGLIWMITFLGGLSQPYGSLQTVDSITYHYLGPKVWLQQKEIRPVLDESQTAFPSTVDIQYAPLMAFGSPSGPAFFSVVSFVLMLLVVASLSLRCGLQSSDVWWVLALISAMPAVYRGLYDGMIDVIYTCFLLLAARIALDAEKPNHFVLAGLFCGFAIGTKYSGLMAIPLLCICVLLFPPNSAKRFSISLFKPLAFAALAASLIAAPWYIRNWILLGSPIYPPPPGLSKIFHVRYLSPEAIQKFNDLMLRVGRALGKDPLHLLMLPFNLTFHTANFEGGAGGIGLVPLAFLPFCFRARSWSAFAKGLGLFGGLMTVAWFYTMQESRYLIQVYLIATIFAVAGWRYVVTQGPASLELLSALVLAVSFLYGGFMIVTARADDMHSGLSASFAERRRHEEIPFLESFRYLNRDASVRKVLILDPLVPSYYLDHEYLKPLGRRGEQPIPGVQDPREVLSDLQKWKITHVMDVQWEEGAFQVPDHAKDLALVFEAKGQRIYRVLPAN